MADPRKTAAAGAASSASTLILLQICSRILTFVLNQLLVRLVSPSVFGLANIQLELLISTILFLSRDAFRTILIRNECLATSSSTMGQVKISGARKGSTNSVHNLSLLPIPIGFTLTMAACTVYIRYISPEAMRFVPTFRVSIALYALGALSELVCEPLIIRAVRLGHPTWRVKAEGIGVFVKTTSTIATIVIVPRLNIASLQTYLVDERATALFAFGIGQASYSFVILAVLMVLFFQEYGVSDTLDLYIARPDSLRGAEKLKGTTRTIWFDRRTLSLCATMAQQGLLKHCLTEADKFAVARYATLEDQGGYALASNYGSLVARILFQPIEETTRIVFSAQLPALDCTTNQRTSSRPDLSEDAVERVGSMLCGLFRMHILLACCMTAFGAPLSTPFLYIVAGPRWALETSAPTILAAYTWYLPIMGINGIVEGFVQSVASEAQVNRYSRVLLIASAGFIMALAMMNVLVDRSNVMEFVLGKTALVWANAFSLAIRAAWCWSFVIAYVGRAATNKKHTFDVSPRAALPSSSTLVMFALVAAILRVATPTLMPNTSQLSLTAHAGRWSALRLLLPTLTLTASCLATVLCTVILVERHQLQHALRSLGRAGNQTRKSQ